MRTVIWVFPKCCNLCNKRQVLLSISRCKKNAIFDRDLLVTLLVPHGVVTNSLNRRILIL